MDFYRQAIGLGLPLFFPVIQRSIRFRKNMYRYTYGKMNKVLIYLLMIVKMKMSIFHSTKKSYFFKNDHLLIYQNLCSDVITDLQVVFD